MHLLRNSDCHVVESKADFRRDPEQSPPFPSSSRVKPVVCSVAEG